MYREGQSEIRSKLRGKIKSKQTLKVPKVWLQIFARAGEGL
jgi:hypothetical protein